MNVFVTNLAQRVSLLDVEVEYRLLRALPLVHCDTSMPIATKEGKNTSTSTFALYFQLTWHLKCK